MVNTNRIDFVVYNKRSIKPYIKVAFILITKLSQQAVEEGIFYYMDNKTHELVAYELYYDMEDDTIVEDRLYILSMQRHKDGAKIAVVREYKGE